MLLKSYENSGVFIVKDRSFVDLCKQSNFDTTVEHNDDDEIVLVDTICQVYRVCSSLDDISDEIESFSELLEDDVSKINYTELVQEFIETFC